MAEERDARIGALDGLRGIAVLLVLLFHLRLGPFRGGFVGVTLFFTLSGFLITRRTIAEVRRHGRLDVRAFLERRVRRLAPAALLCVLGVLVATAAAGSAAQLRALPADAVAALGQVANWRFLAADSSYAQLFAAPSPLQHFWSLAIEEQFYVLFPLVTWAALRSRAPRRTTLGAALAVATAVSSWQAWSASSADRFYYGTDTRMFELLVGVALAVALARRRGAHRRPHALAARLGAWPGVLALGGIAVAAVVTRNGSTGFGRGGAQSVALLTAVTVHGALRGSGPLHRLLSLSWLRWLGTISYGLYLVHWPIVALMPRSVGPLHGWSLGLVQLAASVAIAAASWYLVERRITTRRLLPTRRAVLRSWAAGVVVVAVGALVLVPLAPLPDDASTSLLAGGRGLSSTAVVAGKTERRAPQVLRVAVAGDSTGHVFAAALARFATAHPDELAVLDLTTVGCPVTRVDAARHYAGERGMDMTPCTTWPALVPPQVAAFRPDVAVVFVAMMEQADQRRSPADRWHDVEDPAWAAHQRSEFELLSSQLGASGAPVLWSDVPYMRFQEDLPWVSDAASRTDALNALLLGMVAAHPEMSLLDLAGQLNRPDHEVDTSLRPDGIHLSDAAADRLAADWLLPRLRAAAGR